MKRSEQIYGGFFNPKLDKYCGCRREGEKETDGRTERERERWLLYLEWIFTCRNPEVSDVPVLSLVPRHAEHCRFWASRPKRNPKCSYGYFRHHTLKVWNYSFHFIYANTIYSFNSNIENRIVHFFDEDFYPYKIWHQRITLWFFFFFSLWQNMPLKREITFKEIN